MEDKKLIKEALKSWVNRHSEEAKIKKIMHRGRKSLNLNELYQEIEDETEIGKEMAKNLINLTIDLLSRDKASL